MLQAFISLSKMARMNENEFKKIQHLCRIECTPEEETNFRAKIQDILSYVEQLQDVKTEGVEPCFTVLETLTNVMRDDVVGDKVPRDVFLTNAPAHVGSMVRVPQVMKE